MFKKIFAPAVVAALSMACAVAFAASAGNEARDQASPVKMQVGEETARYWSHPRLGMVKVDAAGRMLTGDSAKDDAARSAGPSGNRSTRTR